MALTDKLTAIANAIREKTGGTDLLTLDQMPTEIAGIETGGGGGGGGGASVSPKEVNFYDYDGTVLYAYTVEEAQALTELPALPEREGLICQGWNWSLEDIKAHNRAVDVGATYITDDGKTRIYISLQEGRTSPMLGVCPNGTVTVDWGDGTEPDVLTGTSTTSVKWTPTHNYASAGDYVISLTVDGTVGFGKNSSASDSYTEILRHSSSMDGRNSAYQNAVQRIEMGSGVTAIRRYAFCKCYSLKSVSISFGVTIIENYAFMSCRSLESVSIPNSVTNVRENVFEECTSLESVSIPNSVTTIAGSSFKHCYGLKRITIPNSVNGFSSYVFDECDSLTSIIVPNGVFSFNYTFRYCYSLISAAIPNSVTNIGAYAFYYCGSLRYVDFTNHTAVPTLSNTNAFSSTPADLEIRVPAALYDEWIAATNWSTYASQIVAV
jgi:hypothetical protein